jgi:hypothetical protein
MVRSLRAIWGIAMLRSDGLSERTSVVPSKKPLKRPSQLFEWLTTDFTDFTDKQAVSGVQRAFLRHQQALPRRRFIRVIRENPRSILLHSYG